MYVCICNAIRDNELRDAALRCTGDAEAVYALLGKTPQCRQCLDEAEEMIAEERALAALAGELLAD
jgi:bacterioferritin-associated ferredoxin